MSYRNLMQSRKYCTDTWLRKMYPEVKDVPPYLFATNSTIGPAAAGIDHPYHLWDDHSMLPKGLHKPSRQQKAHGTDLFLRGDSGDDLLAQIIESFLKCFKRIGCVAKEFDLLASQKAQSQAGRQNVQNSSLERFLVYSRTSISKIVGKHMDQLSGERPIVRVQRVQMSYAGGK
eukprot:CAMPEP_0168862010 /NCGR_PEP_ID=MMETSP0727-20121128/18216_1 /TAXON_ID=265536 /ORGANISM="Amphiprora sp., Strain CCMP467" /LENGTH=173 /DNA_ID=CAMNT_0008917039 /DNA_START=17 /DNA_END=539 /DNA_ORIENTATION=+